MNTPASRRRDDLPDVSRRGFLKGAGVLAATPLLVPALERAARAQGPEGATIPAEGIDAELRINGAARKARIEPRFTLLEVLRDQLNLTGTKEVCARGACGACNVLLDGIPVNSCLTLAADAIGREITTIEGLAQGEQLDAVQAAFVRHDALQCGYCTPGFVLSVKSLLSHTPKPTVEQVREACAGNLCRCGTYNKIFEAALAAAGVQTPIGNTADNAGKALQNDVGRVDAALKVTGRAKYTTDVNLPNMAYAAIVYCPFGRAKLKSADEDAARAVRGVLDVAIEHRQKYIYCGQPTGHVCAETRAALADAIAALKLKWTLDPPVLDPVAEHTRVNGPIPPPLEKVGNDEQRAGLQSAFSQAHRIVEQTFQTQIQTHSCLEPHCAVADFRDDSAEVWISTQGTGSILEGATGAFGLPASKVKAHCEFVGGGFGSKFGIDAEGVLAIQLSKKLKRPVKVVNDRKREQLDTGCRPGSIQYMKFATDEHGHPVAGHVHVVGVSGPGGGGDATNPSRYDFGEAVKSFQDLDLSVGGARAMRAPGHPQGMFAVDSFVDELALAAGVDPLEYRKRIDKNETRKKMYDLGAERIGWASRPKPDGSGQGRLRRGIGVGVGDWGNGKGNAQIHIDVFRDGSVKVYSGTQDIGTGTRTVLADVVAHHLGIDRKLITADCGNSEYPPGPASGGSMVTRGIVPAIRDAAEAARKELKAQSGADFSDMQGWLAACKKIAGEHFTVSGKFNNEYWGKGSSEAVQFAAVDVDTQTGQVFVRQIVALQNCGQAINRLMVENQIIGGVIQGTSFALYEEKLLDPTTGAMVNPNLEMYKIMGPVDCPEIIPIIWHEKDADGARSIGEPPVIPTAGAIANAVANAIGTRVRSLPITPAKVLAALAEKGGV
ncbi:MAG: molybdopterin-dependent oxidoreductase [Phycisphaerae bacterium]